MWKQGAKTRTANNAVLILSYKLIFYGRRISPILGFVITNIIKLFNPTNFLLFVSPPHLNNDIQNTFKVGIIINTKNKINDGITDKAINSFLDLLFFFK